MSCILKNTKECLNQTCNKSIEKRCKSFKSNRINIDTEGGQIFNVPHNQEGMKFLALCKKYLNSPRYRLVKRGRASKRPKHYNSAPSVRHEDSEWFAVYPKHKPTKEEIQMRELEYKRSSERWSKQIIARDALKLIEAFVQS